MIYRGYDHGSRGVGIRDIQLVLPSVICSTHVARKIANEVSAVTFAHHTGCAIIGEDVEGIGGFFTALAKHPNIGTCLIVGLGCETIQGNELAEEVIKENSATDYLVTQESGGVGGTFDGGVSAAKKLLEKFPGIKKDAKELHIGIEIGHTPDYLVQLISELENAEMKVSQGDKTSLMQSGAHLIISFPEANQPPSGFPFIPTINISSDSALHLAVAADFDLPSSTSVKEIAELVARVANGEITKAEKTGSGEIVAPRAVRSV